jgi:uncharacterized protein
MQRKIHLLTSMVRIFTAVSLIYSIYCAAFFFIQRPILFPVSHLPKPPEPDFNNLPVHVQWVKADDFEVETWYLPPSPETSTTPHPLIIFAHGNAELIDYNLAETIPFTRFGFGVLLVEYPGYGRSSGHPSQKSITRAMTAAYDMVIQRPDIDRSKIVLFGRSLGSGAVCQLAARRSSAALILVSAFTGIRSFTTSFLIPGFIVRDPFDNLSVVKNYNGPILIIHGKFDDVVSYHHGVELNRASKRTTMITYNCHHNDCPPDRNLYMKDIIQFLAQNKII